MQQQSQTQKLVVAREDVVVRDNSQVPVVEADNRDPSFALVTNLLRAGCPAVQVTMSYGLKDDIETLARGYRRYFDQISLPGEQFQHEITGDPEDEVSVRVIKFTYSTTTPALAPMEYSRPPINTLDD